MKQLLILLTLALLCAPNAFAAGGLGLSPSIIQEAELVRGETYSYSIKILSNEETDRRVALSVSGDGATWIFLRDPATNEFVTEPVTIPANEERSFYVDFILPEDLPNGRYEGHFEVTQVIEESESTVNPVSLVVRSIYRLDVTGDERKTGTVPSMTVRDTESGQPLRIRYDFFNTGNVAFAPTADVTVKKDGADVERFEREGLMTRPDETLVQTAEWSTEGHGTGTFTADVTVKANGVAIGEDTLTFNIEPRGTFTADIFSGDPVLPEELLAGKLVRGYVDFHNVGKIDLTAKVQMEVFQNDELVDVIKGEESLVIPTKHKKLEFFFKPTEAGDYVLKGKLLYSGREKELEDMHVTVQAEEAPAVNTESFAEEESGSNMLVWGILAVLVVLGGAFFMFKKK
ncbi:MAG: hypothetical protein OXR66_01085 [Candidatus Woesearchaeota archaeon]|nr:hypothetical protein [Candidatus Woesearchaeota archaeon]